MNDGKILLPLSEMDVEGQELLHDANYWGFRKPNPLGVPLSEEVDTERLERTRVWLFKRGLILMSIGTQLKTGDREVIARTEGWTLSRVPLTCVTDLGRILSCFAPAVWPPVAIRVEKPNVPDEHIRLMKFFFGCGPTDPAKLPPAPQVVGRSYESIWDD